MVMTKSQENVTLNYDLLALFAKTSYCRNFQDIKGYTASDSLIEWADKLGHDITGWEVLSVPGNTEIGTSEDWNGFAAVAYGRYDVNRNLQEIVIAYRGTDNVADWTPSNLQILLTFTPFQKNKAIEFYNKVVEEYQGIDITITGHSLGGALAQYVASLKQEPAVTFNAPGIDIPSGGTSENIINYVNMNDPVGSYRAHIGETRYYLPDGMYAASKINLNSLKLAA